MCPTCGRLLKDCLCWGLVVGFLYYGSREPMDKHDPPKTPKAEATITYNYETVTTTAAMPMTSSTQLIQAALENLKKDI
jgi:hypothetical protein